MKNHVFLILVLLFVLRLHAQSIDQHAVVSSGDFFEGGGHNLSFTLGETFGETFSSETTVLTGGFQQDLEYHLATPRLFRVTSPDFLRFQPLTGRAALIVTSGSAVLKRIRVFSPNGSLVLESDFGTQYVCDLENMSKGLYIVLVQAKAFDISAQYRFLNVGR